MYDAPTIQNKIKSVDITILEFDTKVELDNHTLYINSNKNEYILGCGGNGKVVKGLLIAKNEKSLLRQEGKEKSLVAVKIISINAFMQHQ